MCQHIIVSEVHNARPHMKMTENQQVGVSLVSLSFYFLFFQMTHKEVWNGEGKRDWGHTVWVPFPFTIVQ